MLAVRKISKDKTVPADVMFGETGLLFRENNAPKNLMYCLKLFFVKLSGEVPVQFF